MADSISRSFMIPAAHWLTEVPLGHKCRRLHGHNFEVEIGVERVPVERKTEGGIIIPHTDLDEQGMVVDYDVVDKAFGPTFATWDHNCLNDFFKNPTSEHIARQAAINTQIELDRILGKEEVIRVTFVTVKETPKSSATYVPPYLSLMREGE